MAMLYPKNLSDASRALPRTLAILCLAPLHNGPPASARLRALLQPRCSLPAASLQPPARWAAAPLPKPGGLHCPLGAGRFLRLAPPSRRPPPAPSSAIHARARMLADEAPPLWLSSAPPRVRSPPRTGSARSAGPPPRDPRARLALPRAPAWAAPPAPTAAASRPGRLPASACRPRWLRPRPDPDSLPLPAPASALPRLPHHHAYRLPRWPALLAPRPASALPRLPHHRACRLPRWPALLAPRPALRQTAPPACAGCARLQPPAVAGA
nr:vegetative cell wall protein gp1-like [Aegilops tauschii subsp. strangulata]